MQKPLPRIAITSGEPAGIGPDLCVQLIQNQLPCHITIIIDPDLLQQRATELKLSIPADGDFDILPVKLNTPVKAGVLEKNNANYVLKTIDQAIKGCMEKKFHAMVTAPIHKGIINDAGIPFSGHTEYLAEKCGHPDVVMMLATEGLRVALATTHLPLSKVSQAITKEKLESTIRILHNELSTRMGIKNPDIFVCGLNPHAGEDGHLGHEEKEIIEPLISKLQQQNIKLTGPLSADTLFTQSNLKQADVVLAMYHDQGLPVLKHIGFGQAVNITLGLPIIRTSVDHGTALHLAGTGKSNTGSLDFALQTALSMQ